MKKSNRYSEKIDSKETLELKSIAFSRGVYSEQFILAVLWELENRNEINSEEKTKLKELEEKLRSQDNSANTASFIPATLPASIKFSAYSIYLSFLLTVVDFVAFNTRTEVSFNGLVLPDYLITLIIGIFLHLGKSWARCALYIIFAFTTVFFIIGLNYSDLIDFFQQLLISLSVLLISMPQSIRWYSSKRGR